MLLYINILANYNWCSKKYPLLLNNITFLLEELEEEKPRIKGGKHKISSNGAAGSNKSDSMLLSWLYCFSLVIHVL